MIASDLGNRMRARREDLQLSLRGLADRTDGVVSQATIVGIETGKTPNPGLDKLRALAGALGWTLDQLDGAPASAVRSIPLRDLEADADNPRTVDVGNLVDAAFVDSIRSEGLLQAVTVRASPDVPGKWRIAFGGRRYAALVQIHGADSTVPVAAKVTEAAGPQLLLQQLVENVQRADMNPMDLAEAVTRLVDAGQDTQALATALRKGRRWVQEQASVGHHLTGRSMGMLRSGQLSISQAVALAAERDAVRQDGLADRAAFQALNEDEIRAVIADTRAKDAAAKAAEAAAAAPALIEEPPKPPGYPTANEHGVFTTPSVTATWSHKRGSFSVRLVQFGDYKFAGAVDCEWRAGSTDGGGRGEPLSRTNHVQQTAALAFLDAARAAYVSMRVWSRHQPEDIPAMRELHDWVEGQLAKLEATERVLRDWRQNCPPPALPAKAAAASKAPPAKKAAPPLTLADVQKLPDWAKPLKLAHFVVLDYRKATLVKGWKAMAALYFGMYERSPVHLPALAHRLAWDDDEDGKPFNFDGEVFRITDMKAR